MQQILLKTTTRTTIINQACNATDSKGFDVAVVSSTAMCSSACIPLSAVLMQELSLDKAVTEFGLRMCLHMVRPSVALSRVKSCRVLVMLV